MTPQFADTYYFLALVNTKDNAHPTALQHTKDRSRGLITTTWVLVEFADALSGTNHRAAAARFLQGILTGSMIEIVPPSQLQFEQALERFERRQDKEWSLTDCLSFLLMEERGITEALTADHHFEQAGFLALMREA
jgi:predicted nucleic acid-binding protein